MQPLNATIAVSGTVSSLASPGQGTPYAIWCPTVTSGDLFIQGAWDTTSANYVRIQRDNVIAGPTSGDLRFPIGPGSLMVLLPTGYQWPANIRLETAVAQTAAVTFKLLYRTRMM